MRQKHLIFGIVFLVLCSFLPLTASSQTLLDLENAMKNAEDQLYNDSYGAYTSYKWSHNRLETMISEVRRAIKALGGITLSPSLHPATQGADGVSKIGTAVHLSKQIRRQLTEIEKQREITEMLWVGNEYWIGVDRAWVAFENAVNAYNSHPHVSTPIVVSAPIKQSVTELYFCYGPCDELFETASLAQVSHQVYCSEKHGTSGTTGVTYYICSASGTCDRSSEHWLVCGGTCGKKFAPKRINRGQGNYDYVADSPHYVKCDKGVYSVIPGAKCGKEYYTCQHSTCPKSNTHWSAGSSPPPNNGGGGGGNNNPPPTDNTPNCSGCTSDCSSPCSCTDSGTCGGTVTDNTPSCPDCTEDCSSPCSCTNSGACGGSRRPAFLGCSQSRFSDGCNSGGWCTRGSSGPGVRSRDCGRTSCSCPSNNY